MSMDRPSEFNQGVADADTSLTNAAKRHPVDCLERVAEIFRYLSDRPADENKTLRKVAARAVIEARGDYWKFGRFAQ